MARSRRKRADPVEPSAPRWLVTAAAAHFFLVQVVVLPGAYSTFRLPKEALALTGLAAIAAVGFSWRLRRGALLVPRSPLAAVLAAYPALLLVSAVWAASPRRALASAAAAAVWVAAIAWISTLEADSRRRVVVWCAVGAAISAGVMLLQAAGVHLLALTPSTSRGRMGLTGLTGNPGDLAMAVVLLLPLLISLSPHHRRGWRPWVLPGLLAATAVATQTLTGIAAVLAVLFAWLMVSGSRKAWLAAAAAIAAFAVIAAVAGVGTRLQKEAAGLRAGNWGRLLSARGDGWSAAAQMVATRPVEGVGAGNFTHHFYPARLAWLERHGGTGSRGELATHFEWAHCEPLHTGAELGSVGAAWLLLLGAVAFGAGRRAPPLALMAAAAFIPFALLHFPTRLAVGMLPLSLILGAVLAAGTQLRVETPRSRTRTAAIFVMAGAAILVLSWQLGRVRLDQWLGKAERTLVASTTAGRTRGAAMTTAVERQAAQHMQRSPGDAPWLWRVVGRARLARGDAAGSEQAFTTAMGLWPHEEAEFGLGLALAARGRHAEALHHLGRVCRVNPALIRLIADEDTKRAVRSYLSALGAENLQPKPRRRPG